MRLLGCFILFFLTMTGKQRPDPPEDGRIQRDGCEDQDVGQGWRRAEELEVREDEGPRHTEDDGDEAFAEESLRRDEVRAEEEVEAGEEEFHKSNVVVNRHSKILNGFILDPPDKNRSFDCVH